MIIRPIARQDLPALQQIAEESGPGFTSLVDDRDFLIRKIQHSIDSFRRDTRTPRGESYLFVLEDSDTGRVIGTTGIEATAGLSSPLYHYRLGHETSHSEALGRSRKLELLSLCNHYSGCSEICTLYLRPQYRRAHAGKLLSKVRFLFMAQNPHRFTNTVIAEMRGVSDETGQAPFWDWQRQHFVDMDFATVTQLVGSGNIETIAGLLPQFPLYTHLLSEDARGVIGQVHENTRPALHLLEAEGFRHKGYVDPFDGGPTVEAELGRIRSIAESVRCRVQRADEFDDETGTVLAVANTGVEDFRAGITARARFQPERQRLLIPSRLMDALNLNNNDSARFLQLAAAPAASLSDSTSVHRTQQQELLYAR